MNLMLTLEGGLRIDAETPFDWEILQAIVYDAAGSDLAENLGALVTEETVSGDWNDFVVPDLKSEFEGQIAHVSKAVNEAKSSLESGTGSIWIKPSDAMIWYGALNQARLALEEAHHLGDLDEPDLPEQETARRSAFFRSQFYLTIQSILLERVMK